LVAKNCDTKPAIAEAQPVANHGDGGGPHAHLLLGWTGQPVQVFAQSDLAADPRHNPQLIQPLDAHASHDAPFHSQGLMLTDIPKTCPSLLRNVGHSIDYMTATQQRQIV
jgi:hypothetical protein